MMSFADDEDGNAHSTLRAMNRLCMEALDKNPCSDKADTIDPQSFRRRLEECADSNEVYVAYEMKAISPPGMPPPERNLFVRAKRSSSSPPSRRDPFHHGDGGAPSPPHFHIGGFMEIDVYADPTPRQRSLQRFDPPQQRRPDQSKNRVPHQSPPPQYDFFDSEERIYYAKGDLVGLAEISHQPYSLTQFGLGAGATTDDVNCRPVVNHLVVAERARTSGIGSRLLQACEKHILEFWRMDELTVEVYENDGGDVDKGGALSFFLNRDFDVIFSDYTYDSSNHGTNRRVLRKFFGPMAYSLKQKQEQQKREQLRMQTSGATSRNRQSPLRNTGTIVDVSFSDDKETTYSNEGSTEFEQEVIVPTTMAPSSRNQVSVRCDPVGLHNRIF
jgi:GNAT superfamily N-acetyltransferase